MYANNLIEKCLVKLPVSSALAENACCYISGRDSHVHFFDPPYHTSIDHGEGCYLVDVDGNRYVDCVNAAFCLLHGHCFTPVTKALEDQIGHGTTFMMPTDRQVEFALLLCERIPSFDEVWFVSSGSELTSMTVRAARAYTGRRKIMKVDGGYHGTHEIVQFNWFPSAISGPLENIRTVASDTGMTGSEIQDVIIFPYNESDIFEALLVRNAHEVAAVIMEPMVGPLGMIVPQPGFLETVRWLTRKFEVLLIFDEVVQFPASYHGTQGLFGVTPDLTALGKGIGGGFPIGAWVGPREIM